jgi:argininosuccinate synthase
MKIVLAYSGGLDTSVALHWLRVKYDAEIIAYCANIGQQDDLSELEQKARSTGASEVIIDNAQEKFLREFCFPALQAEAAYQGKYLLAAPLSRPLIAQRMVEIALEHGADAVAHGATGKGNDQVRFYSAVAALAPKLRVLAPVIDWEMKSRDDEIQYANDNSIPINITPAKPYSIDTNIWGSSIECGVLDDIGIAPPKDVYQITVAPENAKKAPTDITICFEAGVPVGLDGAELGDVEIVSRLNSIGGECGVGRIDILENRVVGIKTRGVYEAPAATILHAAHNELQNLVTDRDSLRFQATISQRYAELVYDGLWFSPLRAALQEFTQSIQRRVTGEVALRLQRGRMMVLGRSSSHQLYDATLASYGADDTFDHAAGRGFAYVWSLPIRERSVADERAKGASERR